MRLDRYTNLLCYTFDQSQFQKDFVIMNQIPTQDAKTSVRKDFYKLINNSNFEVTTVETMQVIVFVFLQLSLRWNWGVELCQTLSKFFVSIKLLGKEINENKLAALEQNGKFYEAKKNSIEIKRKKYLVGVFSMKFSKKKYHKKNKISETDEKIKEPEKDPKTKIIAELHRSLSCSITGFAVKQNNTIKPTTIFFSSKMLMFAIIYTTWLKLFAFRATNQRKFAKNIS